MVFVLFLRSYLAHILIPRICYKKAEQVVHLLGFLPMRAQHTVFACNGDALVRFQCAVLGNPEEPPIHVRQGPGSCPPRRGAAESPGVRAWRGHSCRQAEPGRKPPNHWSIMSMAPCLNNKEWKPLRCPSRFVGSVNAGGRYCQFAQRDGSRAPETAAPSFLARPARAPAQSLTPSPPYILLRSSRPS